MTLERSEKSRPKMAKSGAICENLSYTVMSPINTRAKTNHEDTTKGDSL